MIISTVHVESIYTEFEIFNTTNFLGISDISFRWPQLWGGCNIEVTVQRGSTTLLKLVLITKGTNHS